ncbi:MAG: type II toxin-antitoxin system Phd/YefM family antitoxin [Caldilineaceae bacterium]|nr:type II toxin-antitoxin system Phd/YefM family antitoxin [Caldilineaceae bacterium]
MKEYTYSEARQRLADLLDLAQIEGAVRIRRRDGSVFVVSRLLDSRSPLDVPGVDLGMTADDIVDLIREGRRFT